MSNTGYMSKPTIFILSVINKLKLLVTYFLKTMGRGNSPCQDNTAVEVNEVYSFGPNTNRNITRLLTLRTGESREIVDYCNDSDACIDALDELGALVFVKELSGDYDILVEYDGTWVFPDYQVESEGLTAALLFCLKK